MSNMKNATLRVTTNYALFSQHDYNRDISKTKLLEQSMAKYGFDEGFPIRCVRAESGCLCVTHGHHRLHVAQKLGLPVWYIVASNDIPLFESEASNHSWSVRDYATARARSGDADAAAAINYHKTTGIPLNASLALIGGESAASSNKATAMKQGKYEATDNQHARDVAEVVEHCGNCGFKQSNSMPFVSALSKCLLSESFDKDLFMHKVSKHHVLMEKRRGSDDYLDMIELVYNRQSQTKTPVKFDAINASKYRQRSFGK